MNHHFHQSPTSSHQSSKSSKKRVAEDQLQILETSFNANQKLKGDIKLDLAFQLGLPPRQIAIWYHNRRARHKIEAKEHEYKSIQQELGNVLAEKIKLEKEVGILNYELNKAQQMLFLASTRPMTTLFSGSTYDDDHSNSHSHSTEDMTYNWLDTDEFPGEEVQLF